MSECPVYVRSVAIATGAAIPTNHDNKRTNREVNRSLMDEVCLAASPGKTRKQTNNNQRKKAKDSNYRVFFFIKTAIAAKNNK